MKRRFLQGIMFLAAGLAACAALPRWESRAGAAGAAAPVASRAGAGGGDAWLNYLNAHPEDCATMVNGFVNSAEYRLRFSQP